MKIQLKWLLLCICSLSIANAQETKKAEEKITVEGQAEKISKILIAVPDLVLGIKDDATADAAKVKSDALAKSLKLEGEKLAKLPVPDNETRKKLEKTLTAHMKTVKEKMKKAGEYSRTLSPELAPKAQKAMTAYMMEMAQFMPLMQTYFIADKDPDAKKEK